MNHSAFVTGGNRGIGLAIARELARTGKPVAVTVRKGTPPDGMFGVPCDVTDSRQVDTAFTTIEQELGPVDVLVANAGITRDVLLAAMTEEEFAAVVDTNLVGTFRVINRAARTMIRQRRGRIILVSSVTALLGSAGQTNYAASKAGMIGLARSLVRELGARNITVNVVAPGFVDTDMTAALTPQWRAEVTRKIPLGRIAGADEVARVVAFLAGEDAGYITGAVIPVDGGLGMGH
ncbi:3-oxoacyl-ACP reductase FabG [Nocardia ninae]|uniref:3-oxoacyl-[acyl-carrier-protein] reductase MabA n=1 Tax=Nocardia ninae NBRC 108245 TaxID=1210091 RepID=A0A511M7Z0_9NOCA|nr:3-oxoacyl-ACP reductase FabG [Nocardia ninae]GEM36238.1 beta-ketoacyl-ACP reductase [Nocardia ninae NBRC 108245]